jgi:hypothetical protein
VQVSIFHGLSVFFVQTHMSDTEILMDMITKDISLKQTIVKYQEVFTESCISISSASKQSKRHRSETSGKDKGTKDDNESGEDSTKESAENGGFCGTNDKHFERFLIESIACFLVTGFVVFRFYEVGVGKNRKVVPIVVPITEIQWMYETGDVNYESDLVLPDVMVPAAGFANKTRFYMYKFRNFNGISSSSLGIAFTLVESYKKWKMSEIYNEILQRENIKTSVFVEQRTVTDTSVVGGIGAHSVASAPLISRLTENNNFRSTTHAPILATPTEEIRESIEEIVFEMCFQDETI